MRHAALPCAALCCLLLAQCQKPEADPNPLSLLPPATQTGADTFGCLVNGQAYLPEGRVGLGSNYNIIYDPTYNGGDLDIGTYRVGKVERKYLAVSGHHIARAGTYSFGSGTTLRTSYTDFERSAPCNDYDSRTAGTFSKGTLTITRLDYQAGIISGTFDYLLAKAGCDTLRITQGRFDAKL